ncbi:heparanase-like isoform X2 [Tubulanus polymorphus]|uniref:heparanase-like isoform X2 n=1 Tax=Tubulanus polymorphus TaxID=672921 RepID=UPI003DA2E2D1
MARIKCSKQKVVFLTWFIIAAVYARSPNGGNVNNEVNVTVDNLRITQVTDERFLSVAVDASGLANHWARVDLNNPELLVIAQALEPLYLRVGGTVEDSLYFDEEFTVTEFDNVIDDELLVDERRVLPLDKAIFNGNDWDKLNTFIQKLPRTELYFGLNVLIRKDGAWDPSNALKLFQYTERKNYSVNFQLGNEPTDFKHIFHTELTPEQDAADFIKLRSILNKFPKLKNSKLVGPDSNDPRKLRNLQYFTKFIKHAAPYVNGTTWHQTATLDTFVDADLLDTLRKSIENTVSVVHNVKPKCQVWLGETSSTYGGGTEGLSDRYVAGFMWLDKLGLSARYGLSVVVRQSLIHGHYALINDDYSPRPDFWLSWIYKNLVSKYVLDVIVKPQTNKVRLYAHCIKSQASGYPKNTVVLYGMNLMNSDVNINLPVKLFDKGAYLYLLTPHGPEGLRSKLVELNGEALLLPEGKWFPPLQSKVYIPPGKPIRMPAKTFGFVTLLSKTDNVCNSLI